jgi:signal transduction histidine kinase
MCDLIDTTIEDVRGLAIRLRPGVLDHLGLVDAIEWFTTDFEKRFQITCIFAYEKGPEIRGDIATAAYRITQEALTNVARHATATRVEVNLYFKNENFALTIKDNGKGFDPNRINETQSLGVVNMKERATLVGGYFTLKSKISGGTQIHFSVPLTEN